ncbi:MAG: tRNA (N(6)-L-threonylcarbamoyladenosine(37)-C(2))-methylthiotransferase MtaB [Bacteroidetes bacterium]|nr:tRNA (N(6)-L-threonylcarbamoyladenosine(37)-C(2))-methylthiotransferase MtaB [Bacteroidota bacterium]
MSKSVAFYTLGCKLNYSESSAINRQMQESGFDTVPFQNGADVYVINTCSVTENADNKCRKIVKQALKFSPNAFIVVIGCYAQLKPEEIANIPGVDIVLGAAEKFNLVAHLQDITKREKGKAIATDIDAVTAFKSAYSIGDRTRTFLKVQDGCDYTCAFCTIPLARGKSRSDTIAHIINAANEIAVSGVKEVVLTGVNIGDFGKVDGVEKNDRENFYQLVQALEKVEGIERFRISSIEPNLLQKEIITCVANSKKFVPHFHIPLQSGSDTILKRMRRRYLSNLYEERLDTIKSLMPDCCIGVDVITGFPGETDAEFLETYNFLNKLDISYLHVFTYSERPNTAAITMDGIVPKKVRDERTQQLINLSIKKRRYFYEQFVGTTRSVLFEAESNGDIMFGFTDNYIRVKTQYDPMLVNEVCQAELLQIDSDGDMWCNPLPENLNHTTTIQKNKLYTA